MKLKRPNEESLIGGGRMNIAPIDILDALLSLSGESRFTRCIGLPTTADGCAPTITAVYEVLGPANLISVAHYPKMGVGMIYETD